MARGGDFELGMPDVEGMDMDYEGPDADYLIDTTDIYEQTVYENIRVQNDEWEIIDESEAAPYLPDTTTKRKVTIGLQENRKEVPLSRFDSVLLDDYFELRKGHLLNTGGSIWGLDFVPKGPADKDDKTSSIQYLAVAGLRGTTDQEHFGLNTIQPTGTYKNAIQLWRLKLSTKQAPERARLDMCLLHDFGVICDLRWCPYGVFEDENTMTEDIPKLGILSLVCGDGTVRIVVVPQPNAVRENMCSKDDQDTTKTIYLKIKAARCTLGLLNTSATCLSWGGHKKLAVGHGNGHLSIWNVERALRRPNGNDITKSKLFLMLSLCCMDSCIRSLNWNGYHDPTKIFMGGYDGQVLVFDTLDPFFTKTMFRSRGLVCGTAWSHHSHILFHIDSDGHCRGEGFAKDNTQVGFKYGLVQGFVWEMCVSPHHGHFAVVSALGWVRSNNMFMNKKKKLSVVQKSVYKLHYDEETDELRYIDGIGYHNLDELRASPAYNQYGKSLMSIHKAAWNPNRSTSAFLATGGAAGLCRIDFEGKGSKWN